MIVWLEVQDKEKKIQETSARLQDILSNYTTSGITGSVDLRTINLDKIRLETDNFLRAL